MIAGIYSQTYAPPERIGATRQRRHRSDLCGDVTSRLLKNAGASIVLSHLRRARPPAAPYRRQRAEHHLRLRQDLPADRRHRPARRPLCLCLRRPAAPDPRDRPGHGSGQLHARRPGQQDHLHRPAQPRDDLHPQRLRRRQTPHQPRQRHHRHRLRSARPGHPND